MTISKKNIIIAVVVVLVVIGVAFFINKTGDTGRYSVVYLMSGEVYVGKLTQFPDLELKDAYVLQVIKDEEDPTKSNFQLNPIKDALWAPESMHFIKDNVVFYGQLLPTSKIAETLASQTK